MRAWCEYAWLGEDDLEAGVVVEIDGGQIAHVTTGVTAPPSGALELRGATQQVVFLGDSVAWPEQRLAQVAPVHDTTSAGAAASRAPSKRCSACNDSRLKGRRCSSA